MHQFPQANNTGAVFLGDTFGDTTTFMRFHTNRHPIGVYSQQHFWHYAKLVTYAVSRICRRIQGRVMQNLMKKIKLPKVIAQEYRTSRI